MTMARARKTDSSRGKGGPSRPPREDPPAAPMDVVDGIPDRSPYAALWKYLVLALIFLGWVAFLVYCRIAGAP